MQGFDLKNFPNKDEIENYIKELPGFSCEYELEIGLNRAPPLLKSGQNRYVLPPGAEYTIRVNPSEKLYGLEFPGTYEDLSGQVRGLNNNMTYQFYPNGIEYLYLDDQQKPAFFIDYKNKKEIKGSPNFLGDITKKLNPDTKLIGKPDRTNGV